MSTESIKDKLEAARKAAGQSSGDANKVTEPVKTETTEAQVQPGADDPAISALENLVLQRQEVAHPRPEIPGDDIIHAPTEPVVVPKAAGYYAYTAGSLNGSLKLIKLEPTPHGNYQSFEDAEATGTIDSWEFLISIGKAYKEDEVEE